MNAIASKPHSLAFRVKKIDPVPDIPAVKVLRELFALSEPASGELLHLRDSAMSTIREVELAVKEVGGDPFKSDRYLVAKAIVDTVDILRDIQKGSYDYTIPESAYSTGDGPG